MLKDICDNLSVDHITKYTQFCRKGCGDAGRLHPTSPLPPNIFEQEKGPMQIIHYFKGSLSEIPKKLNPIQAGFCLAVLGS